MVPGERSPAAPRRYASVMATETVDMVRTPGEPRSFPFRRRHRLSRARDYAAVFDARVSARRGPITVYGRPNGLGHARLGLSVGRRVGRSVERHSIKRRLREAFRLLAPEIGDYDLVVTVRPHREKSMERYREMLDGAAAHIDRQWRQRRSASAAPGDGATHE